MLRVADARRPVVCTPSITCARCCLFPGPAVLLLSHALSAWAVHPGGISEYGCICLCRYRGHAGAANAIMAAQSSSAPAVAASVCMFLCVPVVLSQH